MNIRVFSVIVWAAILAVFTCAVSVKSVLYGHTITFMYNPYVDFSDFFNFSDIRRFHHDVWEIKIGHFLGFGILDILLFNWLRKKVPALVIAILFALLTEIIQLYFYRDGRLYDLLIDSAGILMSYVFVTSGGLEKKRN